MIKPNIKPENFNETQNTLPIHLGCEELKSKLPERGRPSKLGRRPLLEIRQVKLPGQTEGIGARKTEAIQPLHGITKTSHMHPSYQVRTDVSNTPNTYSKPKVIPTTLREEFGLEILEVANTQLYSPMVEMAASPYENQNNFSNGHYSSAFYIGGLIIIIAGWLGKWFSEKKNPN